MEDNCFVKMAISDQKYDTIESSSEQLKSHFRRFKRY
jgi:hypothetical protein